MYLMVAVLFVVLYPCSVFGVCMLVLCYGSLSGKKPKKLCLVSDTIVEIMLKIGRVVNCFAIFLCGMWWKFDDLL